MKPMYEKVLPTENSSWRYYLYASDEIPFCWHYHPEYEICLTLNSGGQRYIGDNINNYSHLDLVFLGPMLPHTWCSDELLSPGQHLTYVAQLPRAWIERVSHMPELALLGDLLKKSQRGIEFSFETAEKCCALFDAMADAEPMQRFIGLMEIFQLMIEDSHARLITSDGYTPVSFPDFATEKIDRVIAYIHQHYTTDLCAEQMAALAHMSTNHFHRFFKQRTEQTFTEYVNQLRIGRACSLLLTTDLPISTVSYRCGFNNISNFNRRFLQLKNYTPREFKRNYYKNISMPL
jgi:AraC-like DNA-binding protein